MKQIRAIKIPIYPNLEQETLICKTFGCTRFIWNHMLSDENEFYLATDKHFIPTPAKYKKQFAFLKEVDSLALANVQLQLKKSFNDFFVNQKNFRHPKFKSKKRSKKSYTTNCQYTDSGPTIYATKNSVRLPKLGLVKANLYRTPPEHWILKSATVSQTRSGKFFCSLVYEFDTPVPQEVLPTETNTIGLDYSSPDFYVDDQGNSPQKKKWLRVSEEKLAHEQRLLANMKHGSKNYRKQLHKIQLLHEHIANQRKDFIHKESRRIANAYGAVCVEDLDLRAMSQSLNFGKVTADNGFGMFRIALKYKLEEQGKHLIFIDKWYPSSKTCSFCGGYFGGLELGQKEWVCPHCKKIIPRDKNAGINIKREGIRQFYAERTNPSSVA